MYFENKQKAYSAVIVPRCLSEVMKYCLLVQLCSCFVTLPAWTPYNIPQLKYFFMQPRGCSFEFTSDRFSFDMTQLTREIIVRVINDKRCSKNSILKNFRSLTSTARRKGRCKTTFMNRDSQRITNYKRCCSFDVK